MKYTSRYPELGFYVGGSLRKFNNGHYSTEDAEEIAVLDNLTDAQRIDEPKAEETVKPAVTQPARKPSGK